MKKGFRSCARAMARARQFTNASEPRVGRIKKRVLRAFIANNWQPLTTGELLPWCYPRLKRFQDWHRWSVRRALLQVAQKVGRSDHGLGLPFLWRLQRTPNGQTGGD